LFLGLRRATKIADLAEGEERIVDGRVVGRRELTVPGTKLKCVWFYQLSESFEVGARGRGRKMWVPKNAQQKSEGFFVDDGTGQVWIAAREVGIDSLTNVVLMGMGEPLANFDSVVAAMNIMQDDLAYGLSKYRVTLSTAGIVPALRRLREVSDVSLAVSLHAPNDALRNELVPINRKYPIAELLAACRDFIKDDKRRKVTFEYVMLDGVNDSDQHARELVRILSTVPSKVNLIPFNPFPNSRYRRSPPERILRFQQILMQAGIITMTRKTRGDDIDAACGQLVGRVKDRSRRELRLQRVTAVSA